MPAASSSSISRLEHCIVQYHCTSHRVYATSLLCTSIFSVQKGTFPSNLYCFCYISLCFLIFCYIFVDFLTTCYCSNKDSFLGAESSVCHLENGRNSLNSRVKEYTYTICIQSIEKLSLPRATKTTH